MLQRVNTQPTAGINTRRSGAHVAPRLTRSTSAP